MTKYTESNGSSYHYLNVDPNDGRISVSKEAKDFDQGLIVTFLKEAFLPHKFPTSVSNDYIPYQIFDTSQAFCSSITGLLAQRRTFKRFGVGDALATATSATLQSVSSEVTAHLGKILFTWKFARHLDSDAKQWRYYADILNDGAMLLELGIPTFPKSLTLPLAMTAALLRALCGICGAATRVKLSEHFAKMDNMADLNAKDASQETVVMLCGMLAGMAVVEMVTDESSALWPVFIMFTILHLAFNYLAVKSVVMPTMNRQRFSLVLHHYFNTRTVLSPVECSRIEAIFWKETLPKIEVGARLSLVLRGETTLKSSTHLISVTPHTIIAAVHERATTRDILYAYYICVAAQKDFMEASSIDRRLAATSPKSILTRTIELKRRDFEEFISEAEKKGWELSSEESARTDLDFGNWRGTWD
ncbi:hypothetical protein SmJEL517_g03737 [Synchytrium microbalum]|uniref:DUF647 domain-containing protein n=1 Tax=Synchytrium microbalum TaxID=1806994 RepID=A0A507C2M4_9FUNG|nr:uncharacterized protein SmJEL517_g03737 [Synchytrium microbalum]TPX33299.1 hypothetical protein SmJEL517_g03737 [Synchytrium microbalum]